MTKTKTQRRSNGGLTRPEELQHKAAKRDLQPTAVPKALTARPQKGTPEYAGEQSRKNARVKLRTESGSALVARDYLACSMPSGVHLGECLKIIEDRVAAVKRGDMSGPEAILVSQAMALESIANEMFRRALANLPNYVPAFDIFMRHGLRAQAQSRANIEALVEMKNPRPVAFIKQANVANGPQQVNNGVAEPVPPRGENEIRPAKLLEQS